MDKQNNTSYKNTIITLLLLVPCLGVLYFCKAYADQFSIVWLIGEAVIMTAILIACLTVGIYSGLFLSVITPVLSYFFSGSLLFNSIPISVPAIMIANILLCLIIGIFSVQISFPGSSLVGTILGIGVQTLVIYILITKFLLPYYGGNLPVATEDLPFYMKFLRQNYSYYQAIAGVIGVVIAYPVSLLVAKKSRTNE